MHTISSYRGNRPTNTQTNTHTNPQTGPITIHFTAKLSVQCNELMVSKHIIWPGNEYLVKIMWPAVELLW